MKLERYLRMMLRRWIWAVSILACSCDQNFDPYTLNGGLVAAVAGKNYVVFASDTRLTSGGYEILSRRHISSRLWPLSTSFTTPDLYQSAGHDYDENPIFQQEWNVISTLNLPHTWIASAGCAADCEALKRYIQAEYSLIHNQDHIISFKSLSPNSIATCLANVLYSRRVFPFYSFCILAGLCIRNEDDTIDCSGVVHMYDAIGSHERVAVATAGTGREILQPILDRLFAESSKCKTHTRTTIRTSSTMPRTHVECPVDEAVGLLLHGYRAASEREIQVGDSVVVGILEHVVSKENENFADEISNRGGLKRTAGGISEDKMIRLSFQRFLLKKH